MSRNTALHRLLIGVAFMGSVILSACGARVPADGARSEEPVVIETPDVVGGNVFIDSVDVLILESFPVQVRAVIQGNLPDGCTEIRDVQVNRAEGSDRFEIAIVTHRDPELMCTEALVPFEETVSLDVDGLPAGSYTVEVQGETATFELPAGQDEVFGGISGDAFIDRVDVLILESFPVQVRAVIQGNLPDGCTDIQEVRVEHEEGSNLFEVTIVTHRDPELMCTMALVPFEESVSLDVLGLSAGTYTVDAHGVTGTFELVVDNVLETD
jgi:hypothetical protein